MMSYDIQNSRTTLTISVMDSRRASALVKVMSSGLKRWSLHMLSSMLMSHFEASVAMAYEAIRASLKSSARKKSEKTYHMMSCYV